MLFLQTLCRTSNFRKQWNDSQIYLRHKTIYRPWQKLNFAENLTKKKMHFEKSAFTESIEQAQKKRESAQNSAEKTSKITWVNQKCMKWWLNDFPRKNFMWSLTKRVVYLELCTPRWAGFRWVSVRRRWWRCGTSSARSLGAKVSGPLWPGQWSEEAQKCTQWWGLKIFYSCKTEENRQG